MKYSNIFLGLASLGVVLYGIDMHHANTACFEIVPPQGHFTTMLLDKCAGQTFIPVKEDMDSDEDGKTDGYSYRWTRMIFNDGGEVFWHERK